MNEKLFNDLPDHEIIQGYVYESKESMGLNVFKSQMTLLHPTLQKTDEQLLTESLNYLRPLLEEGKLKIMVCDLELTTATEEFIQTHKNTLHPEFRNVNIIKTYKDLTPNEAIIMIKNKWNSYTNLRERTIFEEDGVAVTLPENKFRV